MIKRITVDRWMLSKLKLNQLQLNIYRRIKLSLMKTKLMTMKSEWRISILQSIMTIDYSENHQILKTIKSIFQDLENQLEKASSLNKSQSVKTWFENNEWLLKSWNIFKQEKFHLTQISHLSFKMNLQSNNIWSIILLIILMKMSSFLHFFLQIKSLTRQLIDLNVQTRRMELWEHMLQIQTKG